MPTMPRQQSHKHRVYQLSCHIAPSCCAQKAPISLPFKNGDYRHLTYHHCLICLRILLETPYFPKLPETPSPKSTQPLMRALKNLTPITTAYPSARRLLKKRKQNIQMPQRLTLSYSTPLPRFTPNSSDNFIIFSHDIKKDVLD